MSTLATTFAAIVAAPLPTQDRVDLARYLFASRLVDVTQRALDAAVREAELDQSEQEWYAATSPEATP